MKILQNILIAIVIFCTGYAMALICEIDSKSNAFKRELIDAQYDALEIADSLLLENSIHDKEYLKAYNKVDSLYWESL